MKAFFDRAEQYERQEVESYKRWELTISEQNADPKQTVELLFKIVYQHSIRWPAYLSQRVDCGLLVMLPVGAVGERTGL